MTTTEDRHRTSRAVNKDAGPRRLQHMRPRARARALPAVVTVAGAVLASTVLAGLAIAGCTASSQPAAALSPAASASSGTGGPAGPLASADGAAPRDFVALVGTPAARAPEPASAGLYLGSAATGTIATRRLIPAVYDGMRADGAAVGRDGNVWATYSKGPAIVPDGFGPTIFSPDTCGDAVVEWNLQGSTPRATVYQRSGDNVLLGQAVPSPNGQLLAYTEQPCNINGTGVYLRVTDVSSKRSWTIGQALPGCHILSTPAWSADGTQLLEGYAAANLPYNAGADFCTGPQTERLLRLDALAAQPGAAGQVTSPDGNCQVNSVAGLAGGSTLVLEGCGRSQDYALDFGALLVVGPDGRHQRTIRFGACSGGRQLAGDASGGSVLIAGTTDCDPASARSRLTSDLWDYSGGRLRLIAATPESGREPNVIAW
jgi:hypothetical protein